MMRRRHAVESELGSVEGQGERVSVICTVIDFDRKLGEGTVDDGTGTARVVLEDFLFATKMVPNTRVRIIGRVYRTEDDIILRAEVVQDFSVDISLYSKVKELERRVLNETGV